MIKLDKNEKVILEARKHWFILFTETFFLIFLLLFPLFIFIGIKILNIQQYIKFIGDGTFLSIMFIAIWFLFIWIIFFVIWTNYYLDILIVTNKRIIDIEQKGLFSREVSTFRLDRIQDITIEVRGILATLLDFGDVHIQTAGEKRDFVAKGAPHPTLIKRKIRNAYNEVMQ